MTNLQVNESIGIGLHDRAEKKMKLGKINLIGSPILFILAVALSDYENLIVILFFLSIISFIVGIVQISSGRSLRKLYATFYHIVTLNKQNNLTLQNLCIATGQHQATVFSHITGLINMNAIDSNILATGLIDMNAINSNILTSYTQLAHHNDTLATSNVQ